MIFRDREDAGLQLAGALLEFRDEDPIVLALPRGGVVLGYQIARALNAPLDVVVVRKLGAPGNPEFGFGAVAPGGVRYVDPATVGMLGLSEKQIDQVVKREQAEMERRLRCYRGERPLPDLRQRTAVLVDDGLATGGSARAAVLALRKWQARQTVLAVPVSAGETARALSREVDRFVCLHQPALFMAVGQFYSRFEQTSDQEVIELLERARRERAAEAGD